MKPVIYQIFVRLFGNKKAGMQINGTKEENGCGKFDDISNAALNSLKQLGVTHIWYTGAIEHAVAADYSRFGIENDYPEIVKGRAGSPYAIKDYYDVNPDLANDVANRMAEFEGLIKRTHSAGMKVIMDFVPNHVARAYRSDAKPVDDAEEFGINDQRGQAFSIYNDFYYLPGEELKLPPEIYDKAAITEYRKNPQKYREFPAKVTGNDCFRADPGSGDWYETVKLNYGVDYLNGGQKHFGSIPPLWEKMRSVILYWAKKKVDGFRVDMAEMVPVEFWAWVIASVKRQHPDLLFIAEIYQPVMYRDFIETGGFDYLYDKIDFYEAVRDVIENKDGTQSFTRCWQRLGDLEKYMLRFLENHDEQRIASRFFAGDPWKAIPGMVLAATMNSGPLLLYFGQEVGEPAEGNSGFSGDDGRTTIFDYWGVPNHQKWMNGGEFDGKPLLPHLLELRKNYAGIIRLCTDHMLFSDKGFYDLMWVNQHLNDQSPARIYAYLRYNDNEKALVILNFGNNLYSRTQLFIPDDALSAMGMTSNFTITKKIVFPEGNDGSLADHAKVPGKLFIEIFPRTAMVLILGHCR
jgi:glycosidase